MSGGARGATKASSPVIPGRVGIEERPEVVNLRERFGDWESDTVEGAKGRGLVVNHVERKNRYTVLGKLADKKAATLSKATARAMKGLPGTLRHTATFDNGKEFADFKTIERELGLTETNETLFFSNVSMILEKSISDRLRRSTL